MNVQKIVEGMKLISTVINSRKPVKEILEILQLLLRSIFAFPGTKNERLFADAQGRARFPTGATMNRNAGIPIDQNSPCGTIKILYYLRFSMD